MFIFFRLRQNMLILAFWNKNPLKITKICCFFQYSFSIHFYVALVRARVRVRARIYIIMKKAPRRTLLSENSLFNIRQKILPRAVWIIIKIAVFGVYYAIRNQKHVHSKLARDHILANVVTNHKAILSPNPQMP